MSVSWPGSLPSVELTGWNYQKKSGVIKSEMEVGPPKRRRRTTAQMAILSGKLLLSASQVETFRQFVETDLKGGMEVILWPEFIEGQQKEVVLSLDTNGDLYSVTQTSESTFEVRLKLEVLP